MWLGRLCEADLTDPGRLLAVYAAACRQRPHYATEHVRLCWVAAAVRARRVGRDPPRLFAALVQEGKWSVLSDVDFDGAARMLNGWEFGEQRRERPTEFEDKVAGLGRLA